MKFKNFNTILKNSETYLLDPYGRLQVWQTDSGSFLLWIVKTYLTLLKWLRLYQKKLHNRNFFAIILKKYIKNIKLDWPLRFFVF